MNDSAIYCIDCKHADLWIYVLKLIIAAIIIIENVVVAIAILQNWNTLMRQHNLYRYVLSLVTADFLNGFILFIHAVFWIIIDTVSNEPNFQNENFQEVLRNLITGVLHGLTFASLASAALLNLVLRVTSTKALARAAAITSKSQLCLNGVSWVRNPRISIGLIATMWSVTLAFIVIPLAHHCHSDLHPCLNKTNTSYIQYVIMNNNQELQNLSAEEYDCSILRNPSKRSYLLVLNSFIASAWLFMLLCNALTICIRTEVRKGTVSPTGRSVLKLRHSVGITRDSSSFFACVITLSMTVSTIPFVIFTFLTEIGSPEDRMYYAKEWSGATVDFVEMTTYFSSALNPIIYTAMLSRLRSNVSRLLNFRPSSVRRSSKKEKRLPSHRLIENSKQ